MLVIWDCVDDLCIWEAALVFEALILLVLKSCILQISLSIYASICRNFFISLYVTVDVRGAKYCFASNDIQEMTLT